MPTPPESESDCRTPVAVDGTEPMPITHPALVAFVKRVCEILDEREAGTLREDDIAPAVAEALAPLVRAEGLLTKKQKAGCDEGYTRHLLYEDPDRRFTVLSLVWQPDQSSPIHGHTSWCAVGVVQGTPTEITFNMKSDASGARTVEQRESSTYSPGDTCFSREGWDDAHRVYNASREDVVTLHVYGLPLATDPAAINLLLD